MSTVIHTLTARTALAPRREPYWGAPIEPHRSLGFRKIDAHRGSWIARALKEDGGHVYRALGELSATFDHTAAVKAARAWFAELDDGVLNKGSFTVADACKEYAEDRRREKGEKCAADAEWRFERAIAGTELGRTEVAKLRTPVIKAWRDSLIAEDDEGRQMGRAGANRMMATVRAALNLAIENRRVSGTAAQAWRAVKQYKKADGRREIFLDLPQRRALLAAADPDTRDLLEAALLTGARPGELVSATRAAFDGRTKTLKLAGKTGPRDVPLSAAALALFERLAKSKLPAALLLTRGGQPWTRIEWSRRIRAAAESAVVKDANGNPLKDEKGREVTLPAGVVLYSCRHTYISQAILDGLSALDVARLTGTSLQMIDEHYGHLVQGAVRERLAKVQML